MVDTTSSVTAKPIDVVHTEPFISQPHRRPSIDSIVKAFAEKVIYQAKPIIHYPPSTNFHLTLAHRGGSFSAIRGPGPLVPRGSTRANSIAALHSCVN